MSIALKKILREQDVRIRANNRNVGAASERARKPCSRRGREPSEEAAGQAAVIVDHDPSGELACDVGLISNHLIF
jgi:hypothetical protein